MLIIGVLVILYMLVPIAVIFFFSFNNPAGRYNFTWVGFTLNHWKNVFGIPELNEALWTSIKLALLATLVSTVIGTMMALALVRHQFFGRRAANFLIVIPMATPEIVMGSSLLSFFLILGTPLGFTTLLIAHVMFCISFVVVVVRSRLIGFDRRLEEAAKDLGANSWETFRLVTLPLILPGVFGGAMLAFALSIDDFVISNFNAGTTVTFPLYIFGAFQRGVPVEVNCIAMILFGVTVLAMGFTTWQQRRAEKMASIRPDQEELPPAAVTEIAATYERDGLGGTGWRGGGRGYPSLTTAGRFVRGIPVPRYRPCDRPPLTGRKPLLYGRFSARQLSGRCGSRGAGGPWLWLRRSGSPPAFHLRLLLLRDPEADRFAADPVERLGGDTGDVGVDEGEASRVVGAVEGQRGEGQADHVGRADAVAGVARGDPGA